MHVASATDGSEDSLVHCIKPGSMAADAAVAISVETATLFRDVKKDDVDTDPFPSDEVFEENETIVDDENRIREFLTHLY